MMILDLWGGGMSVPVTKTFWCLECWRPMIGKPRHICAVGLCGDDGQHFDWCSSCREELNKTIMFMFEYTFRKEEFSNRPRLVIINK